MEPELLTRPEFFVRIWEYKALWLPVLGQVIPSVWNMAAKYAAAKHARNDANLAKLFYPNDPGKGASLIHPCGHNIDLLKKTLDQSPTANEFWPAYLQRFSATEGQCDGESFARPGDGLVMLASPAGNLEWRRLLYGGDELLRHAEHHVTNRTGAWSVDLQWAFVLSANLGEKERPITRKVVHAEKPTPWESKTYLFAPRDKTRAMGPNDLAASHDVVPGNCSPPHYARSAHHLTYETMDWLLITVLPRGGNDPRRIVNFAGLHRPGTRAARLLLGQDASSICNDIVSELKNARYYQALLQVDTALTETGEAKPERVRLRDVCPLKVNFA